MAEPREHETMTAAPEGAVHDVVVVGSGAAAMTAAVVAGLQGLSVLLVEKAPVFGGAGALSGGVAWLPGNPHARGDSLERTVRYLENVVRPAPLRRSLVEAFYAGVGPMLRLLEERTAVRFGPTTYVDYKSHLDGAMAGARSIAALPYDGRELGAWFRRLRAPMPELCVLGSMMVSAADVADFERMGRSPAALARVLRRLAEFGWHRLRYGRGARLVMGNALMGRLLRSALDVGVTLWPETAATGLEVRRGRVVGVKLRQGSRRLTVEARRGVVLGAGGFAHDPALSAQLTPGSYFSNMVEGDTGDGLRMGLEAGGKLGTGNFQNFLGTQSAILKDDRGQLVSVIPFLRRDRNKPGFVLVNRRGRRFVNEAWPYNDVAHAMNAAEEAAPSFLICDHVRLRRYGLGLVRPGPAWLRPLGRYLRPEHITRASTICELAAAIGVDAEGLQETVARMNAFARSGVDLDFHKGESAYDIWQGDPDNKPNPCLGPIETGPFYALKLWPGNLGTSVGLVTDERARVLDADDRPVAGLYAVGCDMHSMTWGHYGGGGSSIGPGMTFGYIAACDMARAATLDWPLMRADRESRPARHNSSAGDRRSSAPAATASGRPDSRS